VPGGRLAYYNSSKTASNSNVLQVLLRDHGFERVESADDDWSVFWCAGQVDPEALRRLAPWQKVNKFPKASALTLKANLWTCFKQMQDRHGREHFGFMPTTFVLPREIKAFERRAREMLQMDDPCAKEDDPAPEGGSVPPVRTWIFKPAAAYCGRGIWMHRFETEPDATAEALLTDEMHKHKGVVSAYLEPFLIDGLKSDVRLYVLVTSFHPLNLYLYEEGLARFATEPYHAASLDERCGHLTNYSLNKFSDKFVKNTNAAEDDAGSKWSLSAFRRRLVQQFGEERVAKVWREVDDLVVKTVMAAEPVIVEALKDYLPDAARGEPTRQCFQLFGFDVMLDDTLKPHLLEVNLDPALRTESPLDLKIKSSMLLDALNTVGLPLPPPQPPSLAPAAAKEGEEREGADPTTSGSVGVSDELDESSTPSSNLSRWVASGAAAPGSTSASSPGGGGAAALSDVERWALHLVNAEFERSKEGKWRRLFPSPRSGEYYRFLDPEHTMHRLPFDV
jgi:tubulin polyglutamylase TTLL5